MLTPRFCVDQQEGFVFVVIQAPYVKFSEVEILLEGNHFAFYCKPYHLKLYFSGEIVDNDTASATYDIDAGSFTVKIPKADPGEMFSNLDLLTKLMTPADTNKRVKAGALIEILSSSADIEDEMSCPHDDYHDDEIDWTVEQTLSSPSIDVLGPRYGFNNTASGVFLVRQEDTSELLDLQSPETVPAANRAVMQLEDELAAFSMNHYVADALDEDCIVEILNFKPTWSKMRTSCEKGNAIMTLECNEQETLMRLPKKEYVLSAGEEFSVYLGLVDILYGCLYDLRTNFDESNVESAWTIRKLSSCMSWLVQHKDIRSTVISSVRRSLCFPLYRHWILAMKVLEDVSVLLSLGKSAVLKYLLHIHSVFNTTESYHIMNDLFITDYCVWIQSASETRLASLSMCLDSLRLSPSDTLLNLTDLKRRIFDGNHDGTSSSDSQSDSSSDEEVSEVCATACNALTVAEDDTLSKMLSLTILGESGSNGDVENKPLIQVLNE